MLLLRFFFTLILPASLLADAITLEAIPDRVRTSHPDLQAARLSIAEAQARQLGAGRLPNPSVSTEFQPESRVSPLTASIAFDQTFPLTHRLKLEKKLTTQLVTAAELEVRDTERRLVAEAQSLAVNILTLGQHLVIHQQQSQLAADLVTFTEARTKTGEISPLDSAQARVDSQRLDLETRQLTAQHRLLLSQLKPHLGLPATASLTLTGKLPAPLLPTASSWQSRPDFQLAQNRVHSANTETELAKARRWQDLSAGLFAARERQDVTGLGTEHTGFVGFRLSLPLPFWDRNQGQIAEKTASAERAHLETHALASRISHEAASARQDMAAQITLITETRDQLLPLIEAQTSALEQAYEAGQIDLIALLRAREQQLEAQTTLLDSLRDFHLARIRHETALGTQP